MKKFIYLFVLSALLIACKGNDPRQKIFDPDAMVVIRGVNTPARATDGVLMANVSGLTDIQIVQNAVNIKWTSNWAGNDYYDEPKQIARTFLDAHKDFNKPALLMWGTDIIAYDGVGNYFYKDFIYGYDVFITDNNNDTIAYVPNEVLEAARQPIEDAWNRGDHDEVYRMFNEAFTFLPIKE